MNDDGLQSLIAFGGLAAVILVAVTPAVGIWIYAFIQNSTRKKIRQRILAAQSDLVRNQHWFPARYASQTKFDAFLKIFPWDGAGIIVVVPGSVLFLGETISGMPITLQFAPGNSRINWLGKCPWPNGMISWLRFDTANDRHYFSSETGASILGSHQTTKAVYDEANRNFGAPAAQNI